jgi:hypothetical protein
MFHDLSIGKELTGTASTFVTTVEAVSLWFLYLLFLDPVFNLEETEEQEEQCTGKNDLKSFLTEHLLTATTKHTTCKSTNDD